MSGSGLISPWSVRLTLAEDSATAQADDRVRAVSFLGSTGTDVWTEASDFDLCILLRDYPVGCGVAATLVDGRITDVVIIASYDPSRQAPRVVRPLGCAGQSRRSCHRKAVPVWTKSFGSCPCRSARWRRAKNKTPHASSSRARPRTRAKADASGHSPRGRTLPHRVRWPIEEPLAVSTSCASRGVGRLRACPVAGSPCRATSIRLRRGRGASWLAWRPMATRRTRRDAHGRRRHDRLGPGRGMSTC